MKKLLIVGIIAFSLASCGGDGGSTQKKETTSTEPSKTANGNPSYDPNRGEGKFTKVDVSPTLDAAKAEAGEKVFSVKCSSCHKLSEEKLVGPGWKGVTDR